MKWLGCKNKLEQLLSFSARFLGLCLLLLSLLFVSRNAGVHSCAVVQFAAGFKGLGVQPASAGSVGTAQLVQLLPYPVINMVRCLDSDAADVNNAYQLFSTLSPSACNKSRGRTATYATRVLEHKVSTGPVSYFKPRTVIERYRHDLNVTSCISMHLTVSLVSL